MIRLKNLNSFIAILLVFLVGTFAHSQEMLSTSKYQLSVLNVGSELEVIDPLSSQESLQPAVYKTDRRFRVELNYNRDNRSDRVSSAQWRLTLNVKNEATSQTEALIIENSQLNGQYSAWVDFMGQGTGMQWKVLSLQAQILSGTGWSNTAIGNIPVQDIHLECMVFNNRIVELDEQACAQMNLTGEFLGWNYIRGAVEYDVEWVFIDSEDQFSYNVAQPDGPFKFKEPVRITTFKHRHRLDLIYPTGSIYFRIRPKGYFFRNGNQEVYYSGDWCYSSQSSGNMIHVINSDHEEDKNWQYSVAFAENGMSKSAITYFDGSLRARQQLSRMNSTGQVVAAGSLYDYEGRSTVQIIPTPISSGSLDYYNNLHRDQAGGVFDKEDFDEGTSGVLGTSSGAGRYYSSANSFTTAEDPFRDRIPDAEGYPYSQVKFINDNTGRARKSSGVGYAHRMGGGHESHFYYVKPTERILRELFGSNVGNVTHYDKQISVDPNGQASVSYTDQQGRVIASGLYGGNPENLLPLDNNPLANAETQAADLMPSNIIAAGNNGFLESVTDYYHFNLGSNDIELNYDLVSGGLNSDPTFFGSGCATCFYELEVHVFDPTGAEVDLNYTSQTDALVYNHIFEKYSGSQVDCNSNSFTPTLSAITKQLTLTMTGEYRIIKTLRGDQEAIQDFIETNGTTLPGAPDYNAIMASYVNNIITTNCGFDCDAFFDQECRESLGLPLTGTLSPSQQSALDQCIADECLLAYDELTDDQQTIGNQCEMMLGTFKLDVSPGGWVFEEDLTWRATSANWMLVYPLAAGGTYTPTTFSDLENNWENGWEDILVQNHPEYCHYDKCVDIADLMEFNETLYGIPTMSGAYSGMYVNSTSGNDFTQGGDPLFSHSLFSSTATTWLSNQNSNFQGTFGNIYDYVSGDMQTNYPGSFQDAAGNPLVGNDLTNRIWEIMRGIYLGERYNYIESVYASICSYYDHPSANFIDPATVVNQNGGSLPGFVTMSGDNCPDLCDQNVDYWMNRIEQECELDVAQMTEIQSLLLNYCLNDCDGLTNVTGAIQLSDLVVAPLNADLQAVESILSTFCSFSLTQFAEDDTCENMIEYTFTDVNVLGGPLQTALSALQSVKNGNYSNFIVQPAITALPGYGTMFPQSYYNTTMQIKLIHNPSSSANTYTVANIVDISVIGQNVTNAGIGQIEFTVQVDFVSGSSVQLLVDEFELSRATGGIEPFVIDRAEIGATLITEICEEPEFGPFDITFDIVDWENDCIDAILQEAITLAEIEYQEALDDFLNGLLLSFSNNCFNQGELVEKFFIVQDRQEYAFTLYYYDQAGNLVQTVPPQGVHIVPTSGFTPEGSWLNVEPIHDMKTIYTYNSLGKPIKSQTPDGGTAHFYYNSIQQLRLSQNAEQIITDHCSYIRYDELGRSIEAGVATIVDPANYPYDDNNAYPIASVSVPTMEVVRSYYEEQPLTLNSALGWNPKDLNTRIAAVAYYPQYEGNQDNYSSATFYEYDIHGNVRKILNDLPEMGSTQRYKRMEYDFDLYSGKMKEVRYQYEQEDQFLHRYFYDDDNRLTAVETSRDGISWDEDARYFYYLHGPLARMELGDDHVQGTDYAYSVQGWLKGVNSNTLEARRDLGKDGASMKSVNQWVAKDAIGFSLTYFNEGANVDYTPITSSVSNDLNWLASDESVFMPSTGGSLYNGNIRAMITAISTLDNTTLQPLAKVYQYDQLQRIKEAKTFTSSTLTNNNKWLGGAFTDAYYSSYAFDLNGNLTALVRNGSGKDASGATIAFEMDNFSYNYEDGSGGSVALPTVLNKLYSVEDNETTSPYDNDIKNGQSSSTANYVYDAIGRLITDVQEEIETINWTVTNKVAYIERTTSSIQPDVAFKYDAMGNRIVKIVYPKSAPGVIEMDDIKATFYIRDASGNLMATYEQNASSSSTTLLDFDLFGASRLGVENVKEVLVNTPNFDYCSTDGKASAIIQVNGSEFLNGESVVYKIGSLILNDAVTWNGNVLSGVEKIITAVNKKTVTTGVSAELWWSNNTVNSYYLRFNYLQPGNWVNTQNVSTHINGILATGPKYIPKRNLGLGSCSGNDILGRKSYELSNHLGNVLAVITDRKMGVDDGTYNATTGLRTDPIPDGVTDYYLATVTSYSDYYPYGMQLDNRHGEAINGDYRYGFQGQEKDDEVSGEGNNMHAEFWQYDTRLGRRWNIDPVVKEHESPYAAFANNPIWYIDPDGADTVINIVEQSYTHGTIVVQRMDAYVTERSAGVFVVKVHDQTGKLLRTINGRQDASNPTGLDPTSFEGLLVSGNSDVQWANGSTGTMPWIDASPIWNRRANGTYGRAVAGHKSPGGSTVGEKYGYYADLDLDFKIDKTKITAAELDNYQVALADLNSLSDFIKTYSTLGGKLPYVHNPSGSSFGQSFNNSTFKFIGFHSPEPSNFDPSTHQPGSPADVSGLTGNDALDINRAANTRDYVQTNSGANNTMTYESGGVAPRRKVIVTF